MKWLAVNGTGRTIASKHSYDRRHINVLFQGRVWIQSVLHWKSINRQLEIDIYEIVESMLPKVLFRLIFQHLKTKYAHENPQLFKFLKCSKNCWIILSAIACTKTRLSRSIFSIISVTGKNQATYKHGTFI